MLTVSFHGSFMKMLERYVE